MSAMIWKDMASVPRDGTFIWGADGTGWMAYMRWTGSEWRGAGECGLLYQEPARWAAVGGMVAHLGDRDFSCVEGVVAP